MKKNDTPIQKRMNKVIVLVLIFTFKLFGTAAPVPKNYQFKVYDNKDGFFSPENYFVYTDTRSLLWSAGADGLTKYDGKTFTTYNRKEGLNDAHINCINETKEGFIICGTRKGISFFNGNSFKNAIIRNSNDSRLHNVDVNSIYVSKENTILIGSAKGLFLFDKLTKQFIQIPFHSASVSSIIEYKEDYVLFISDQSIYSFNLKNKKINPLNLSQKIDNLTSIKYYKDDILSIQTDKGLFKAQLKNQLIELLNFKEVGYINTILSASKNEYFTVGKFGYVYTFDQNLNEINRISLDAIFSHIHIKSITEDYQGNFWMASNVGLIKMYPSKVKNENDKKNSDAFITALETDLSGTLFLGTMNGLLINKNGIIEKHTLSQNETDNFISSLCYFKSHLFIGTYNGKLYKMVDNRFELVHSAKNKGCIYKIIVKTLDEIWLSSFSTVIQLKNNSINEFKLSNYYTQDILLDENNKTWFANLGSIGFIKNNEVTVLNKIFENYSNFVTLDQDKNGTTWIGTYGNGLLKYQNNKIEQITVSNGLTNNFISSSIYDKNNNSLWLGTMYGISYVQLNDSSSIVFIKNFLNQDNIESYGCVQNGVSKLSDTKTLFAVGEDLFSIEQPNKTYLKNKINLYFDQVTINKKVICSNHLQTQDTSFQFKSNQNNLNFSFSAIEFSDPNRIKYSWKLKGYDFNWSPLTDRKMATYTNLPSGSYTFKVKAQNVNGNYSDIIEINFTIETPFYFTIWFIGLSISVIGLAIYLFFLKRIAKVKSIEQEKSENFKQLAEAELKSLRAQMNPHFMFNTLNAIQDIVINNEEDKVRAYFGDFSKMIRMILQNSTKKFITLEQEIDFLKLYLTFEEVRFKDKFSIQFTVDKNLDTSLIKIPGMLIQPIIENAINHGLMHKVNGKLKIDFKEELKTNQRTLICIIEDDGIGFDTNNKALLNRINSSQISKDRIEILNALYGQGIYNIEVISLPKKGTKVELRIKFD